MDDIFAGLFACSVLLGIPGLLIWVLVRLHQRLRKIEEWQVALDESVTRLQAGLPPKMESVPEAQPVPAAPVPPAEPVVEVSAPGPDPRAVSAAAESPEAEPPVAEPAAASDDDRDEPGERTEPVAPAPAPQPEPERAPWWSGLEEAIWTKLPVWIGAIALALAAAYLVKFSFDRGWISEPVRVAFGVLGGVALLVLGERLRVKSSYIAQGLSAAGIASLFIAFWAATELYHLVPWWAGFGLLALTTATAVLLSLRQGYLIAVLGMVGGFVTPALVGSPDSEPWGLFGYLLLLQIGLVVVARRRRWGSLGLLTLVAGLFWALSYLSGPFVAADSVWLGVFLLASAATFALQVAGGSGSTAWAGAKLGLAIGWGALGGGLFAASMMVQSAGYGTFEWAVIGLLVAGCYALARFDRAYHPLAWIAAVLTTLQLGGWLSKVAEGDIDRLLWTFVGFAALLAGGAWWLARDAVRGERGLAGWWGALSTTIGVLYLLIVFGESEALGLETWRWGFVAVVLGALWVAGAVPFAKLRRALPSAEAPLAAMAVGATVFFSLSLPMELERQWLTVSWGLEVLALVWLAGRLRVDALRWLAGLMTVIVAVRLLLNPEVLSYPIGELQIFNWLLYGYGVPAAALLTASVLAARRDDRKLAELLQWVGGALVVALVTLQIRQFFFAGRLGAQDFVFWEWGCYLVAWTALALLGLHLADRWPERPLRWGARLLTAFSVVCAFLALGLALNPLFSKEWVGDLPVVNFLLWSYGVPGALLFLIRKKLRGVGARKLPAVLSVVLLLDAFWLVTLEVRQAFHGGILAGGRVGIGENYAYSIAWIVLGVVLALVGAKTSRAMRWGSLCVLLPATFKVFLLDTSHLEGLWRVASLVGLAVALFALAYFFRHVVFAKDDEKSLDDGSDGAVQGEGASS